MGPALAVCESVVVVVESPGQVAPAENVPWDAAAFAACGVANTVVVDHLSLDEVVGAVVASVEASAVEVGGSVVEH